MAKVVVVGVLPINQPDSDVLLANIRPDLDPVAEQVVDRAVGVVECLAAAECSGLVQFAQDLGDDTVGVPLALEPVGQQILLDVAVVGAVLPVAQVGVAEGVPEERDHALLGEDFPLADGAHVSSPWSLFSAARRADSKGSEATVIAFSVTEQPNPAGQERLHHALLDGAGLVSASFQRGDFGVHVGEDGGDGICSRGMGSLTKSFRKC